MVSLRPVVASSDASTSHQQPFFEQGSTNSNLVLQRRIKLVVDSVANGRPFRHFRSSILSNCAVLLENLWRADTSRQQLVNLRPFFLGSNSVEENPMVDCTKSQQYTLNRNTGGEEDSGNELSFSMSLDQSVRTVAGSELESAVELIVSEGVCLKDRLLNIHKLLTVSPSVLAKAHIPIESLLIHLHAILRHQMLFGDAMFLLARILSSKDETVWSRVTTTMCRVAPSVLGRHKVDSASKIRFVDFFLQVFSQGPKIWRKFSSSTLSSVLPSYLELFTSEFTNLSQHTADKSRFLYILAHLEPSAEWIGLWLHSFQTRSIIARKLVELLEDFIGSVNNHVSTVKMPSSSVLIEVCFQASVLFRSIRHQDILEHLDTQPLSTYMSTILNLFSNSNQSILNKCIQRLLLQLSCTHAGADFLVKYSLQNLLAPELSGALRLKLACNTLLYCSQPPAIFSTPFQLLIQIANQSVEGYYRGSITKQRASLTLPTTPKPKNSQQNMVYQFFYLLIQTYPMVLLHSNGLHITQLTAKYQKMDMANSLHTSLLLSSGFLVGQGRGALRTWRKQSSKWFVRACLNPQKEDNQPLPLVGQLPHCLELILQEDKRSAFTAIVEFLRCRNKKVLQISQLDFLFEVEYKLLTISSVVLIAQPGLAVELLSSMNLQHYLEERLNRPDAGKEDQIAESLQPLHLLMSNLEVVSVLRRDTQFSGKLMQLLQKYCYSPVDNQLIVDELSVQVFELLSSLTIRGGWRERSRNSHPSSSLKLKQMIENLPRSVYLRTSKSTMKRKMFKKSISKDSYAHDFLEGCDTYSSDSSIGSWDDQDREDSEEEKEKSRGLEESIKGDWLRLMSVDQGASRRRRSLWMGEAQRRLILRLFTRKRNNKIEEEEVNDTAIGLLKEYLKWMEEEEDSPTTTKNRTRLNTKMTPSQAEWIAPLLDYAVYGLGKASSRQSARQKCAELKFLSVSSKTSGESTVSSHATADWFLGVLFLCADLDAKTTNYLAEKLVNGTSKIRSINCLWPMATLSGSGSQVSAFNDTISGVLYPKVLAILNLPKWKWLKDWLCAMELPLLHLLLLYTNQLYLNILNFGQIEEYLVLGVAIGLDFQILLPILIVLFLCAHFLALLLHIAQSQVAVPVGRQLVHLSRALRLQQFIRPNSRMLQVMASFRFLHFLHLFQEE